MKIFVWYSRRDADFAQHVHEYFEGSEHDIFIDENDIQMGDVWNNTIEENISNCDIFVVFVTHASLRSSEIEREVSLAKRENRTIIPCIHNDVNHGEVKWDLARLQGIKFKNEYDLARNLFLTIGRTKEKSHKVDEIISSTSLQPKSGMTELDNDTFSKEAATDDKIAASNPSLDRSRDSADSSDTTPSRARPIPSRTKETHYYNEKQETRGKRRHGISLKILLPIIGVVVVVGAVVAFSYHGQISNIQREITEPAAGPSTTAVPSTAANMTTESSPVPSTAANMTTESVQETEPSITTLEPTTTESGGSYSFAYEWGSAGSGPGQFDGPYGVAVDSASNVYVTDVGNNLIQKFDSNGRFITKWGSAGNGD